LASVISGFGDMTLAIVGVIAAIAVIIGGVFAGQEMNLIPGSFMTGNQMSLVIDLVITVLGTILVTLGLRR